MTEQDEQAGSGGGPPPSGHPAGPPAGHPAGHAPGPSPGPSSGAPQAEAAAALGFNDPARRTGAPETAPTPTVPMAPTAPAPPASAPRPPATGGGVPPRPNPLPPPRPVRPAGPATTAPTTAATSAPTTAARSAATGAPTPRPDPRTARPAPTVRPVARARKARLVLKRIDPWSVFLYSVVASIFIGIALVVAAGVLYAAMSKLGVLDSVNQLIGDVTSEPGTTAAPSQFFSVGKVMTFAGLVAALDVVLITALATLGAFLYNLCASLTGGIEVTLSDQG